MKWRRVKRRSPGYYHRYHYLRAVFFFIFSLLEEKKSHQAETGRFSGFNLKSQMKSWPSQSGTNGNQFQKWNVQVNHQTSAMFPIHSTDSNHFWFFFFSFFIHSIESVDPLCFNRCSDSDNHSVEFLTGINFGWNNADAIDLLTPGRRENWGVTHFWTNKANAVSVDWQKNNPFKIYR